MEDKVQVVVIDRVIVVEHVTSLGPTLVPSTIAGPGGDNQMKKGTDIFLSGGETVKVEGDFGEVQRMLTKALG
jgi:hypothetical protein